jgi:hypothetical protein
VRARRKNLKNTVLTLKVAHMQGSCTSLVQCIGGRKERRLRFGEVGLAITVLRLA